MITSKYKKITSFIENEKITNFELITNYGLYSGSTNLFKTLTINDLVRKTEKTKGDIIEFGVWKGNTSLLIKKILDIYKIKKKLYLFDHFKGLKHFSDSDKKKALKFKNRYKSNKNLILKLINFFNFKKIKIIDKDATKINNKFFKNKKFCLAILDVDLYEPTKKILEAIDNNISKNGLIVFDEGNHKNFEGVSKAINEFMSRNSKKYTKELIDFAGQPDVILKKI
ncbi:TylF/MycF family methyltransferase [Candidatus Pelagibacter sp.]|jgi:hypothetical protein|nr:TylF/MycF family methyltransferase [Candidatus Pelagibacter sp.]